MLNDNTKTALCCPDKRHLLCEIKSINYKASETALYRWKSNHLGINRRGTDTFDYSKQSAAAPGLHSVCVFPSLTDCKTGLCVCSHSVCTSVCLYESYLKLFISFHKLNEKCLRGVYYILVALWDTALTILIWPNIMQTQLNLTQPYP